VAEAAAKIKVAPPEGLRNLGEYKPEIVQNDCGYIKKLLEERF
jgi:hypothetical protein